MTPSTRAQASRVTHGAPPLSVAPMMDRTDRHFRYFMRQITRRTLLYTEMVVTGAILFGDRDKVLAYDPLEHPLSLQLGGDDPKALAECARIAHDYGYDEINLNVGCPSDRVQNGNFGACLMNEPQRVAEAVAAMKAAVPIPVTVKHRIGVDDHDSYEFMARFVTTVAAAGCERFTVHARIALLQGLNPKQNRTIPPLRYDDVYRLKRELPHLGIEINGGIRTLEEVAGHLEHVDAAMLGRAAYDDPYRFAEADTRFFGDDAPPPSRADVLEAMLPYVESYLAGGGRLHTVTRHLQGLLTGQPCARVWRHAVTAGAAGAEDGVELLRTWVRELRGRPAA